MSDIVQRLREYADEYVGTTHHDALVNEAANEIERLRGLLRDARTLAMTEWVMRGHPAVRAYVEAVGAALRESEL